MYISTIIIYEQSETTIPMYIHVHEIYIYTYIHVCTLMYMYVCYMYGSVIIIIRYM